MIIDTHCHYNLEPFFVTLPGERQAWRQHWQEARDNGVVASLVVGTNLNTSSRALTIAKQDPNLFASIGIHPGEIQAFDFRLLSVDWIDQKVEEFAETMSAVVGRHMEEVQKTGTDQTKSSKNSKIIAIGETGLDYFRLPEEENFKSAIIYGQKQLLISHISIANKYQFPLILHVRDRQTPNAVTKDNAYWDALSIVYERLDKNLPFILHCVSGPKEYVQEALTLNSYVSVAGNVTYPSADAIRELVKLTPQDRILLETDAPFLPPQTHRGQTCEPKMIRETSEYLKEQMGIAPETIVENTGKVWPQLLPQASSTKN